MYDPDTPLINVTVSVIGHIENPGTDGELLQRYSATPVAFGRTEPEVVPDTPQHAGVENLDPIDPPLRRGAGRRECEIELTRIARQ